MTLPDQQLHDLCLLAIRRVASSVDGVLQLVDDPEQRVKVSLTVAAFATKQLGKEIQYSMVDDDDMPVPDALAKAEAMKLVAQACGYESRTMTPKEAKKMGLKR